MNKFDVIKAWLKDTSHDERDYLAIQDMDGNNKGFVIFMRSNSMLDSKIEIDITPPDSKVEVSMDMEPEDYGYGEDDENKDGEITKPMAHKKHVMIDLADQDCFDVVSEILEKGKAAKVPWVYETWP